MLLFLIQARQPSPPCVLVYAPTSPLSATSWVRALLTSHAEHHAPHVRVAHLSPLVSCTPRLVYQHVLQQLGVQTACTDAKSFVHQLRIAAASAKVVLAVYDAERVRDMWPEHLWDMWPLLAELAGCAGQLCVVYVSALPWSAFRTLGGRSVSTSPITLAMPRLSRESMLAWLEGEAPARLRDAPPGVDAALYGTLTAVMLDAMRDAISDEHRLRLLCRSVWTALMDTVRSGATPSVATLMPHVSGLCREALAHVGLGVVGADAWAQDHTRNEASEPTRTLAVPPRSGFGAVPAFLLVAAFIASYNPSKTDAKFFVRELGASRKRKRGKAQRAAEAALLELNGETELWDRAQFWGPHAFSLERLFAIYHALLTDFEQDLNEDGLLASAERSARSGDKAVQQLEYVAGEAWSRSTTTMAQLNELVRQQLIVRVSPANKLSAMQYRVNVPFEYARQVALGVGFPLGVWLWDPYV